MNEDTIHLTERLVKIRREIETPGAGDLPCYLAASDLHGNAERMREIIETSEREGVTRVFLVGDIYSGPGGWGLYRLLRPLVDEAHVREGKVAPLLGNHELALVTGMLGQDKQLRFFYGFGGRELIEEMNAELIDRGQPPLSLSGRESPTPDDLATIRGCEPLREMARWIQNTHGILAVDFYGTAYMHACPRIIRPGRLDLQYQGQVGAPAIRLIEEDLPRADQFGHPVFSPLLQSDRSPVWALFEITSAAQFDAAYNPIGVRQLVFGHRHRTEAVNVGQLNRQIGIAVDFEAGLGGYLLVSPRGLRFRNFVDRHSQATRERQLTAPAGELDAPQTHLRDVEEFLVRRLVATEKSFFRELPANSRRAEREFEQLESLRREGLPWSQRVYAEIYPHVKDVELRKKMFLVVVESCDEEAFRSLIHLLHHKTGELEHLGGDWYSAAYLEAKSIVQVLLEALCEMPVRRLGLLDVRLRGTTSRINLQQLYHRIMGLQDPDLALLAVGNLGALNHWSADQELRTAFFHDVRKVRILAAQELARRGEVAYPLVESLLRSRDNWVRFLSCWTVCKLGEQDAGMARQAIQDVRAALAAESDWLIQASGHELLRKLGRIEAGALQDRLAIPNLTDDVVATLQSVVDSQREPFRQAFRVYFITVAISSLVYRRGLIGMDLDELRIYVNKADFFPAHYRYYKSATRDENDQWQGWRRLWIRGETVNRPDGPEIIQCSPRDDEGPPGGRQTITLYDHRGDGRVQLPDLDAIVGKFGLGKSKDRLRDAMLQRWESFSAPQKTMLCRLHAAAAVKMLFDLPAEIYVDRGEMEVLCDMCRPDFLGAATSKPLITLDRDASAVAPAVGAAKSAVANPHWLDAIKYAVDVFWRP